VSLASRDFGGGLDHLKGALRSWKAAGASQPRGPLENDLRSLTPPDPTSSSNPGFRAIEDSHHSLKQKRDSVADSAKTQQDARQGTE
jgi:hypothetical protein